MIRKVVMLALLLVFMPMVFFATADSKTISPGKNNKCPVCGMFVYKYPDWVGQITFSDDTRVFFDGAKDLFKYYFKLEKYNPGKTLADITVIGVTEYYDITLIDVKTAFFVIGSDVYGPMGKELIPFKTLDAAEEFKRDHRGAAILKFSNITPSAIKKLD